VRNLIIVLFAVSLAGCGLLRPAADEEPDEAPPGGLSGRITWTGETAAAPDPGAVPEACRPAADARLELGPEGGLAGVFVAVPALPATEAPALAVELRARRCRFEPRVVVAQPGAALTVHNDDAVLHTFHLRHPGAGGGSVQNLAVPPGAGPLRGVVDGELAVVSDSWPWMYGAVLVPGDVRWTVTDAEGRFELPDLAPGEWRIELRHPAVGTVVETVTVPESGPASLYASWPSG